MEFYVPSAYDDLASAERAREGEAAQAQAQREQEELALAAAAWALDAAGATSIATELNSIQRRARLVCSFVVVVV